MPVKPTISILAFIDTQRPVFDRVWRKKYVPETLLRMKTNKKIIYLPFQFI